LDVDHSEECDFHPQASWRVKVAVSAREWPVFVRSIFKTDIPMMAMV
jgi:hypothetical protein